MNREESNYSDHEPETVKAIIILVFVAHHCQVVTLDVIGG